jgi:hypothetical protein
MLAIKAGHVLVGGGAPFCGGPVVFGGKNMQIQLLELTQSRREKKAWLGSNVTWSTVRSMSYSL